MYVCPCVCVCVVLIAPWFPLLPFPTLLHAEIFIKVAFEGTDVSFKDIWENLIA